MPTWIALLRGINVSGQKPVPMSRLGGLFESLELGSARTYVQSGNVVFETPEKNSQTLARRIEKGVEREFGFSAAVILRTAAEWGRIIRKNPFLVEKTVDPASLYVTLLAETPSSDAVKKLEALPQSPDRFQRTGREIYLHCPQGYGRTKLSNTVFEKKLSVAATTRNWKTMSALREMAAA